MRQMKTLIDMARAKFTSDAELARALNVPPNHIPEWRGQRRAVSAETAAALCDVLQLSGEECREWVAIAILENPKNSSRAEMLKRALFACWVVGVASLMQPKDASAKNAESASTDIIDLSNAYRFVTNSLYIVTHWMLRLFKEPLYSLPLRPIGPSASLRCR